MLKIGDVLEDKYKILSEIGHGGMSIVYLALNEKVNKSWAVKEIKKEGVRDLEVVKQSLVTEIEILKRLSHRSLPSIVDVIESEDTFIIIMDYIEGVTLESYMNQGNEYTEEDVISWSMQICDVLNYLHSQNPPIIYRDMKPSNIMLKPDGSVVLIDFGASREFKDGNIKDTVCIGTKGYAAPEQFAGNKYGQTDERTDIYGLGTTMYHVLTKHNPCLPPYEMYPIRKWNASFSAGLETIIIKCTKNNPWERYQNCNELFYALEHYDEQDIEYQRKSKKKMAIFSLCLFFLIVSAVVSGWGYYMENRIRNENYETYVADAVLEKDRNSRLALYEKAIDLEPENEKAYNAIYSMFMDDAVLDSTEDQYIRELFPKVSANGQSYESRFATNVSAYSHFAYQMAMAYWYSYGTTDGENTTYQREYNIALRWFEKVQPPADDKDLIAKKEYSNAVVYTKIGSYYADLGKLNRAGDSNVQYSTYLEDLAKLYESEDTNTITRLYLDKEIVYQILEHANDYKLENIDREFLEQFLTDISSEITSVTTDNANEVLYNELISEIRNYIETASKAVSSAYAERGAGS